MQLERQGKGEAQKKGSTRLQSLIQVSSNSQKAKQQQEASISVQGGGHAWTLDPGHDL